jgi:hypothetical protein
MVPNSNSRRVTNPVKIKLARSHMERQGLTTIDLRLLFKITKIPLGHCHHINWRIYYYSHATIQFGQCWAIPIETVQLTIPKIFLNVPFKKFLSTLVPLKWHLYKNSGALRHKKEHFSKYRQVWENPAAPKVFELPLSVKGTTYQLPC